MSKQKVEIKPGQVWREKRLSRSRNRREVRVIDLYNGRVSYVPDNYLRAGRQRPIQEQYFRDGYELVYELVSAPTEAQKEQRGSEG